MCTQTSLAISRGIFVIAFAMLLAGRASAMIEFSLGNDPVQDRNWPAGSVDVANLKSRVCNWAGYGPENFLYRGDAKALQEALDAFAKIRAPRLDVFVHGDGPSESDLLKHDKDPKSNARVDWSFTVWDPRSWNQRYSNPSSRFFANDPNGGFHQGVDPPRMDLFVGEKGIDFSAIKMPAGVTVTDERASSAGIAGGSAVIADFYDMETSKPIGGVQIVLRKSRNGGEDKAEVTGKADGNGHLLLKSVPAGSYDLIASADGYVSRMIGHAQFRGDTLKRYTVEMTGPAEIAGTVTDTRGKRLAGMNVRADTVIASNGRGYPMAETKEVTTDEEGRFVISGLPKGSVQLFSSGKPYFPLDSMVPHGVPSRDIVLRMTATGAIKGKVYTKQATAFAGSVSANPPKDPIGKWGGSMRVAPDGSYHFEDVPPGEYVLTTDGREMPGILITVEAGKTTEKDLVGRD
jgi:Carboxypeptidase regulatory-like domain